MAEETAGLISGPDPDLGAAERRLLAAMPLHAITSVHGPLGMPDTCRTCRAASASSPRGACRPVAGICGTQVGGSPGACAVTARSCAMQAGARAWRRWLAWVRAATGRTRHESR